MKRRIKFIWGASRVIEGRWFLGLFGLYGRVAGKKDDGLAISVRGVLAWSSGLAFAAYIAGATTLFWIWQRNTYSILTYQDAVFYPLRRAQIDEKKGRAFIAQGTDLFRARKYNDAATLLRLGLARSPHDFPARVLLAQYYFLANQRAEAARVLDEGLTNEYPGRVYLNTLFNAADLREDFDAIVQVAGRYAPHLRANGPHRDYRWIVGRQFAALSAAGRHEQALELALAAEPGDLAREHRVLALVALGRAEDAVTFLNEWRGLAGADLKTVARLRVRALREARKFDEMETAIAEIRAMGPADPAPAVFGVVQRMMGGRTAAADAALQDYLFRFGGSVQNLMLVAEPLAEIGARAQLERCIAAAADRGYPLQRFNVLLVQTLVNEGDAAAANRVLASMSPESGREAQAGEFWRTWMQRLIDAAILPGESAQVAVLEMLRERPWPVQMFRRTIESLLRSGRLETARDAIAIAARSFPSSAWVQGQGEKVTAQIASREAAASTPALVTSSVRLPGEKIFFEQLDAAIAARRWDDATRMIRGAQGTRPAPNWVAAREPSFRLAQVRISRGNADRPAMLASARLFLNGDNERSRQLLEAARAFFREGDKDSALAVTREVLSRTPDFPPARRQLAEWEPKPEQPK